MDIRADEAKVGDEMAMGETVYKVTQISTFPNGKLVFHFNVYAPSLAMPYVTVREYKPFQKLAVQRRAGHHAGQSRLTRWG